MKVLILFVCAQLSWAASLNYKTDAGILKGGGNITLMNLGFVDGKSYFYDNSPSNWANSQKFCRSYGMELAKITTATQFEFLKSKYDAATFGAKWYWIAARDSLQLRALAWDDTDVELGPLPPGIEWGHMAPKYQLCGMYRHTGPSQYIQSYSCLLDNSNTGTLCET